MKKAVIISWCFTSLNYGETLQAYAMQRIIQKYGYKVTTISFVEIPKEDLFKHLIKKSLIGTWNFYYFIRRNMNDVKFCFSDMDKLNELMTDAQLYICGSDQIWNPNYIKNISPYVLACGKDNTKRIAYAASMGIEHVSIRTRDKFVDLCEGIKKIDYVSVRERALIDNWPFEDQKNIEIVLDPTLLIDSNEWETLIGYKMVCPEHYMLVYFLGENSIYESLIIQLANKHGLKRIIWIDIEREYKNKSKRITVVNNISPKKFLNLIRYADLVVTDSFHGTLFSITFGRAFYVVPRKYKKYNHEPDARIKDILGRLKLSERMIRYPKDIEKVKAGIDYHEIEKILDEERKKSYLFLTNSIMN